MTLLQGVPLYELDAAIQLTLDGGNAFLLMVSDMNRKNQSDNHEYDRENLKIGHDHHPPFVEKRV